MLSEESAMGSYPVEATAMLTKIAAATEPKRPGLRAREELKQCGLDCNVRLTDLLALSVETAVETVSPAAVIVPSLTGTSARSITRFRLPIWIAAVSPDEGTCQTLQFSYGVYPLHVPETVENWNLFAKDWVQSHGLEGDLVILSAGPSPEHPQANNRMEIIDLRRG
jgi:pyruvate kinase